MINNVQLIPMDWQRLHFSFHWTKLSIQSRPRSRSFLKKNTHQMFVYTKSHSKYRRIKFMCRKFVQSFFATNEKTDLHDVMYRNICSVASSHQCSISHFIILYVILNNYIVINSFDYSCLSQKVDSPHITNRRKRGSSKKK